MVFFGMPTSPCGGVRLGNGEITFDLSKLSGTIDKLAVTATVDTGNFSSISNVVLSSSEFTCKLDTAGRQEAALILLEVYKRNGQWKVRFVGQGFNGGLKPLAQQYGVDVADPTPPTTGTSSTTVPNDSTASSSAASHSNTSSVNLSKISLTKSTPTVDLTKKAGQLGLIKVNLNWIKGGGFFSSAIDLDLGAYIEFKDGTRDLIQALGNKFSREPYIKLLGDDRTGANSDGEWIHINGDKLSDVKLITIFTFIYEGTPNWSKAEAYVTLHVPDMPPIETRLTEGSKRKGFCAIANISVNNGAVQVERLDRYFSGHKECDNAFGWGFRWTAGSK